jgi:molybdopterin-guanine dinucleotide biosynthesis protein MobB
LNEENRGDTSRFRAAGADPVILAGADEAVVFAATTHRVKYSDPLELLMLLPTDIILIEGFKTYGDWPKLDVDRALTAEGAAAILDRIWPP